jgi:hypothetical protein
MGDDNETMGPISYLIVEFPGSRMTGEGLDALVDLVERGIVRVLDLRFVSRRPDGSIDAVEVQDLDRDGRFDVMVFGGISSGLLDQSDFDDAADAIEPGSSAGIVLLEHRWAVPFVEGLRRGGAELVAAGFVPLADVEAALDATDAA